MEDTLNIFNINIFLATYINEININMWLLLFIIILAISKILY